MRVVSWRGKHLRCRWKRTWESGQGEGGEEWWMVMGWKQERAWLSRVWDERAALVKYPVLIPPAKP